MRNAIRMLSLILAVECLTIVRAEAALIDFETPALGAVERLIIDPYVESGVTFTVEPGTAGDRRVGLVKNRATSACVGPADSDQKLGVGRQDLAPQGSVGQFSAAIRATFSTPVSPPATVSVDVQAGWGQSVFLGLFTPSGAQAASATKLADAPSHSCNPGYSQVRTTVRATSAEPVAYAVINVSGSVAFVIDNFATSSGAGVTGNPLWPGDVPVATATGDQGLASDGQGISMIRDGSGGAFVAWEDRTARQVFVQRLDGNGTARWGASGIPVATGPWSRTKPRTVADGAGGVIVVWVDGRAYDASCCRLLYAQRFDRDGLPQWTANGVPVVATQASLGDAGVTSDGAGGALFVWESNVSGCCRMYAQRITASGDRAWSADGIAVSSASTRTGVPPLLVPDGANGAIVAWVNISPATLVVQRLGPSGQTLWTAAGVLLGTAVPADSVALLPDGSHGAFVAWSTAGMGQVGPVLVQRIRADGQPAWTPPGVAVVSSLPSQWNPSLVSDGAGGVIVVWQDSSVNVYSECACELVAQRLSAEGQALWQSGGIRIGGAPSQLVVEDGAGGAIVAWNDCRDCPSTGFVVSPVDIYAQRLSPAGELLWGHGGRPVSTAPGNQGLGYWATGRANARLSAMVTDDAGGAIVAWPDGRNGLCNGSSDGQCDVYAQRISDAFDPLRLVFAGSGSGRVMSDPAAVDCRSGCVVPVASGSAMTLTAVAANDSLWVGWSGCPSVSGATCAVTVDAPTTIAATFVRSARLSVRKRGLGSGTVASSPAGITCGSDCHERYPRGTVVTLTATPASGSTFMGWSGCPSAPGRTCTVTLSAAKAVTARFDRGTTVTLRVWISGQGTVVSNPAGISCGRDCSQPFMSGEVVTLTAAPASGSMFAGWTGCPSATGMTCTLTADVPRKVRALFRRVQTLTLLATGPGTVRSIPAGIECGTDCSEAYVSGMVVTLSAVPASGATFAGWSGCPAPSGTTCTVTMDAARTVTATFGVAPAGTLTVSVSGPGAVTSVPPGIDCGADCTETYPPGTIVTLTASAGVISGWSGCQSGGFFPEPPFPGPSQSCTVTVDEARVVTATFAESPPRPWP